MSLTHSLANAISGMTAASRRAEIVSSNVANALTEGYARRELEVTASNVGGRGAGVQIVGINRYVDRAVLSDRRLADADLDGTSSRAQTLTRLETIIGTADDDGSLSSRIADFEAALIEAGSDPSSEVRLTNVVNKLTSVTETLNRQSDSIQALRQDADADIAEQIETLNVSLKQIEKLNSDIVRTGSGDASSLMDQRQVIIDRIAGIVPLRELDRGNGRIALTTTSGVTLIDGAATEFTFDPSHIITADMTQEAGGLSGLSQNGVPLSETAMSRMAGGTLSAAFKLRDETLVTAQSDLDAIAGDLMTRLQGATDPTLAAGSAGLLTDAGSYSDGSDTVGLSGRIAVNETIIQETWRIRDGVGALSQGAVGSTAQINRWSDAMSEARSINGGAARTAAGHAAALMSRIGSARLNAEDSVSFAAARWDTLRSAELANGVDTDHELQSLMVIEQAYAANARLIQTIDSMVQTLMEL